MKECICPVIEITAKSHHVTEEIIRRIADELRADVRLTTERGTSVLFGRHHTDCPCCPQEEIPTP
jgi:hypothetical protein